MIRIQQVLFSLGALVVLGLVVAPDAEAGKKGNKLNLADGKAQVDAFITKDDPADPARKGHRYKEYVVHLEGGHKYLITMTSKQIDCWLRLQGPAGKVFAEDDDGGKGLNSKILFNCTKAMDYHIICTTYDKGEKGAFKLTVQLKK